MSDDGGRHEGEGAGRSAELAAPGRFALASGRVVEASPGPEGADVLRVLARDGACVLTIEVTDAGPVLRFSAASLAIASTGSIDLACRDLHVRVGGDASIAVAGSLHERVAGDVAREAGGASSLRARDVAVTAEPGAVVVRANDDVDLAGECVLLNSEDPPMPVTLEEYRARLDARRAPELEPARLPEGDRE